MAVLLIQPVGLKSLYSRLLYRLVGHAGVQSNSYTRRSFIQDLRSLQTFLFSIQFQPRIPQRPRTNPLKMWFSEQLGSRFKPIEPVNLLTGFYSDSDGNGTPVFSVNCRLHSRSSGKFQHGLTEPSGLVSQQTLALTIFTFSVCFTCLQNSLKGTYSKRSFRLNS